jgi:hypothetical protein
LLNRPRHHRQTVSAKGPPSSTAANSVTTAVTAVGTDAYASATATNATSKRTESVPNAMTVPPSFEAGLTSICSREVCGDMSGSLSLSDKTVVTASPLTKRLSELLA